MQTSLPVKLIYLKVISVRMRDFLHMIAPKFTRELQFFFSYSGNNLEMKVLAVLVMISVAVKTRDHIISCLMIMNPTYIIFQLEVIYRL